MTKKKSKVQSSTFRLPAQEESGDQIFRAARGAFYDSIAEVLRAARSKSYHAVNFIMVEAYWHVGRMIVEEEQQGKEHAEYGSNLLRQLSTRLGKEFGKGFNETNLRYMRQFYLTFPIHHALRDELEAKHRSGSKAQLAIGHSLRDQSSQDPNSASDKAETIVHALRAQLTWTHYRLLIRVEKSEAREWYMNEAADQNWSTRARGAPHDGR